MRSGMSAAVLMNAKWALGSGRPRQGGADHQSEMINADAGQSGASRAAFAPSGHVPNSGTARSCKNVTSKRSLVFHGWITLRATLARLPHRHDFWALFCQSASSISAPWIWASCHGPLRLRPMPDSGHCADDHRGAQFHRHSGADPQGDHFRLSQLLPGARRHGQSGLRSPDHMQLDLLKTYQRQQQRRLSSSCGCPLRCPISSRR